MFKGIRTCGKHLNLFKNNLTNRVTKTEFADFKVCLSNYLETYEYTS